MMDRRMATWPNSNMPRGLTPNSRPEMVCQEFFAIGAIEVSNGEPRRLRALR